MPQWNREFGHLIVYWTSNMFVHIHIFLRSFIWCGTINMNENMGKKQRQKKSSKKKRFYLCSHHNLMIMFNANTQFMQKLIHFCYYFQYQLSLNNNSSVKQYKTEFVTCERVLIKLPQASAIYLCWSQPHYFVKHHIFIRFHFFLFLCWIPVFWVLKQNKITNALK